jgi:hypothetical protein
MFTKGATFPSESRERRDAQTGARIVQLTSHLSINHNLYFLTSSFTPDMKAVVFASYRAGAAQFFKAEFPAGDIIQLTDVEGGVHGYSGIIASDGSELFYTAGGAVRAVNLRTLAERTLAEWDGASLGECSLSADGQFIVTAMKRSGWSYLTVTRTDGSGGEIIFECPRTIIHPQFHPTDNNLIEYAQDPAPRMWLIRRDGTGNTCLYEHGNDEFIVHETFLGETGDLIFTVWHYALKRMNLTTREISTIAAFNAWHIASNRAGTKVLCDTNHPDIGLQLVDVATGERQTICYPHSSNQGSQWRKDRYALKEDFEAAALQSERERALSWMEMKVDTVYGPQWTHPHPSFSADERWVVYTSDESGHAQVYAVELP